MGAPVEGAPAEVIAARFGEIRDFIDTGRGYGCYTDDTQMMIALATSLAECNGIDAKHCSNMYAQFYEPHRGYGAGTHRVMAALKKGISYKKTGRSQFKEGSFANGGAMRIAPLGLLYRNADRTAFTKAVEAAIVCTHVHPEGIDGALVQARAVALLAHTSEPDTFDVDHFLDELHAIARTAAMHDKIAAIRQLLKEDASDQAAIARLGNGIRAVEAVPSAVWATLRYHSDPETAIIKSISFGGDTDTIGAMTGAQVGTLHGDSWFPLRWYDNLENGKYGRDYIVKLAEKLAEIEIPPKTYPRVLA